MEDMHHETWKAARPEPASNPHPSTRRPVPVPLPAPHRGASSVIAGLNLVLRGEGASGLTSASTICKFKRRAKCMFWVCGVVSGMLLTKTRTA